ncbi:MAG: methylcobamide--CoM methyltransferase [Spirochaetales bacterium]|jgi:[methyl-Co(III) methanol-specific corrinoid protein]:coenzyme M methyltransferase|nr:methylcobamide--CoM methyltransferase [Spirochaetales bacterium]
MGEAFSPKERLHRALNKKPVDRPPVICPGGMMNAAIVEVMQKTGNELPRAHHSGELMAALAYDVHRATGFENFGIPFCMTVEAEALGSEVDYGSLKCEPKIAKEVFGSVKDVRCLSSGIIQNTKRAGAVFASVYELSKKHPDIPVTGSIAGPLSTTASLIDPMTFLKELRREKDEAHRVLNYVTDRLIEYAKIIADSGADIIGIADPTATGEILGPKLFEEYALTYINKLAGAIHELGIPVIVHICGELRMVKAHLPRLRGDALSVDAFVNLRELKKETGVPVTMGNLSTYMLEFGTPEKIYRAARGLLKNDIDILAPACGLSTSTPLEHITGFTQAVQKT